MKSLRTRRQVTKYICNDRKEVYNPDKQKCTDYTEFSLPTLIKIGRSLGMDKEDMDELAELPKDVNTRKKFIFDEIRRLIRRPHPHTKQFHSPFNAYMTPKQLQKAISTITPKQLGLNRELLNHMYKLNAWGAHRIDYQKWFDTWKTLLYSGADPNFIEHTMKKTNSAITLFADMYPFFSNAKLLKALDILDHSGADFFNSTTSSAVFNDKTGSIDPSVLYKVYKLILQSKEAEKMMRRSDEKKEQVDEIYYIREKSFFDKLLQNQTNPKDKQLLNLILQDTRKKYINAYLIFKSANPFLPKEIVKYIVVKAWYDMFCAESSKNIINLELILLAQMFQLNVGYSEICKELNNALKLYGRQQVLESPSSIRNGDKKNPKKEKENKPQAIKAGVYGYYAPEVLSPEEYRDRYASPESWDSYEEELYKKLLKKL